LTVLAPELNLAAWAAELEGIFVPVSYADLPGKVIAMALGALFFGQLLPHQWQQLRDLQDHSLELEEGIEAATTTLVTSFHGNHGETLDAQAVEATVQAKGALRVQLGECADGIESLLARRAACSALAQFVAQLLEVQLALTQLNPNYACAAGQLVTVFWTRLRVGSHGLAGIPGALLECLRLLQDRVTQADTRTCVALFYTRVWHPLQLAVRDGSLARQLDVLRAAMEAEAALEPAPVLSAMPSILVMEGDETSTPAVASTGPAAVSPIPSDATGRLETRLAGAGFLPTAEELAFVVSPNQSNSQVEVPPAAVWMTQLQVRPGSDWFLRCLGCCSGLWALVPRSRWRCTLFHAWDWG
jgi:hypothetical protein